MINLAELNRLPPAGFVAGLEGIFEHSPWVAERTASLRPFDSRLALLHALRNSVEDAPRELQQSLIRAHPQLGRRGRTRPQLTIFSAREQQRAGLDACTEEEWARLDRLNSAYVEKFDMPFILAVRGHAPGSIIAAVEGRMAHGVAKEERTALVEIGKIAGYRLADAVVAPMGGEVTAMNTQLASASTAHADALLREWMWAAHLDVSSDAQARPLGRRAGASAQPASLVLGVLRRGAGGGPQHDIGQGLLALAVLQRLHQDERALPYEVLVSADAASRVAAPVIDLWGGGLSLGPVEGYGADAWVGVSEWAAGPAEGVPSGIPVDVPNGIPNVPEQAAHSLQTFLLRNEQRLIHRDSSVRHG